MPIPTPEQNPDLYDGLDARPGPSKYPKGSSARADEEFERMMGRSSKPRRVAGKLLREAAE